jgi:hypothetical protein
VSVRTDTARPLKAVMFDRLQASGTWMSREDLAQGASSSPVAIDDALADLVLEKKAEYRQAVGYRLAGTVLAREAMRQLREGGLQRAVCARPVKDEYRVGVAERHADLGLVMYELAMPLERELVAHLHQVDGVVNFSKGGL